MKVITIGDLDEIHIKTDYNPRHFYWSWIDLIAYHTAEIIVTTASQSAASLTCVADCLQEGRAMLLIRKVCPHNFRADPTAEGLK